MKNFSAIKIVAACSGILWATASFSQNSGHGRGAMGHTPHEASLPAAQTASPYAGEQNRAIKSLSASEMAGLQSGAGMTYAKAAELNGYPGPAHVLELAGPLQLNDPQQKATQSLMDQHKARARELGVQLVEAERQLDLAFASKKVDASVVDELTRRTGLIQARLRAEHLQTHLSQTGLMTPQQIASYQRLRGYEQSPAR